MDPPAGKTFEKFMILIYYSPISQANILEYLITAQYLSKVLQRWTI